MQKRALIILAVLAVFLAALVTAAVADPPDKVPVLIGFKDKPGAEHETLVRDAGGDIKHRYHIVRAMAVSLPQEALTHMRAHPKVAYIEEDGAVGATADTIAWGVDLINADLVWPLPNTGSGVKVFIIDTGIDYTHPDLAANYQGGYDFVNNDADPKDDNGHGTHVAGIVAAKLNGAGVVGVAPDAWLYGVKVLNSSGSGYVSDVVAGIQWAIDHGAQIINMSLGTNSDFQTLHNACNSAYFTSGIVVVAAAGNDGSPPADTVDYPAAYSCAIAVGATNSLDARTSWSSSGSALELMAPGVSILSTYLNGGYAYKSGTSMAAPHVAGAAALVIASGVSGAATVRQKLIDTAVDLGQAGWDGLYGWGRVDAYTAAAPPAAPPAPAPPPVNQPPVANAGPDQTVTADSSGTATVTLDGSKSSDPEGSAITYHWMEGTTFLSTATSFPYNFAVGTHIITLTVTDDKGATGTDTVVVTVTSSTPQPVTQTLSVSVSTDKSSYKDNQPVSIKATVSLSGSPVPGASVTFTITKPDGSKVTASGTTDSTGTASYTWTAKPKPSGTYRVTARALAASSISGSGVTSFNVR